MRIETAANRIIEWAFYALAVFVPLIFVPANFELFEYNKIMLTYGLTAIIVGAWIHRMIVHRQIIFQRTPLDIPIVLFVLSQIASFTTSIDPHVSFWGYYSRFHGGLLSTFAYVALFYAFVSNMNDEGKNKIKRFISLALVSATVVATYGVLERLGIDKHYWVQDVQNRVFSTLGQPNWLAAYLAILLPVSLVVVKSGTRYFGAKILTQPRVNIAGMHVTLLHALPVLLYTTLIFTKSRSGFLGAWAALGVLLIGMAVTGWRRWRIDKTLNAPKGKVLSLPKGTTLNRHVSAVMKPFLLFVGSFVLLHFVFGAPFAQIDRFSLPQLLHDKQPVAAPDKPQTGGSLIEIGVTESGTIRRIVWQGALDIARNFPLLGTGVETFAYSYYRFRPAEHNLTSEWEFLYNKAHNEYLNFAATTGMVGLGTHLLLIAWFIGWTLYIFKKTLTAKPPDTTHTALSIALFGGWTSILVTNFFGFSVVIVGIFFFLIPAMLIALHTQPISVNKPKSLTLLGRGGVLLISAGVLYILLTLARLWFADTVYARGNRLVRANQHTTAYRQLQRAVALNPDEPLYHDKFSNVAAQLAQSAAIAGETTLSAQLQQDALDASRRALSISPQNVIFWKTRARVLFALSEINPDLVQETLDAMLIAQELAPTDPKVAYNTALLYGRLNDPEMATAALEDIKTLKPNFRDAYYALGVFYSEQDQNDLARQNLEFILSHLNPNDTEAQNLLESLE